MLRRGASVLALAMVLAISEVLIPNTPAQAELPAGCHVVVDDQQVYSVVCEKNDTQGGTTTTTPPSPADSGAGVSVAGGESGGGGGSGGGGFPSDPVSYSTYDEVRCVSRPVGKAGANPAAVQGARTATAVALWCESSINGGPGFFFWSTPAAAAAPPPPPPPVDVVGLSRTARARVGIPQFSLTFGPDSRRLAVNMQTTFTAVPDRSVNLLGSASDRGITVTVAGRLGQISWLPGEPALCSPGARKVPCSGGQVGAVACAGTSCQYTYRWVSSPARTSGAPAWTVTATASWQFSYTTTGTAATTGPKTANWIETMPAGTGMVSMGEWSTVGGFEK